MSFKFTANVSLPNSFHNKVNIPKASLVLLLLTSVGCVSIPPGTGLNTPSVFAQEIPKKAWIGTVKITDSSVESPEILADSLRGNIKNGGFKTEVQHPKCQ